MKSIIKQSKPEQFVTSSRKGGFGPLKKVFLTGRELLTGFTIVELLVVMSIIVVLISLLVPAMSMVKRYSKTVKQNAQFHSIDAALELYNNEFDGYPPSSDPCGVYPGAMQMTEAMVGQDLLGFHPSSLFSEDGWAGSVDLYRPLILTPPPVAADIANFRARKGPYLPVEGANIYTMEGLYGAGTNLGPLPPDANRAIILCDEFPRARNRLTGKRVGMPVLYYKANTSNIGHNYVNADTSIYNYRDNYAIVRLGLPWDTMGSYDHPMDDFGGTTIDNQPTDPNLFYTNTRIDSIGATPSPRRQDSYILISAGYDGQYGTDDDIFNFKD